MTPPRQLALQRRTARTSAGASSTPRRPLFAERGYGATTTREIALRAGIDKRMLFDYFASKEADRHLLSG
jgi:hypothetical protein